MGKKDAISQFHLQFCIWCGGFFLPFGNVLQWKYECRKVVYNITVLRWTKSTLFEYWKVRAQSVNQTIEFFNIGVNVESRILLLLTAMPSQSTLFLYWLICCKQPATKADRSINNNNKRDNRSSSIMFEVRGRLG